MKHSCLQKKEKKEKKKKEREKKKENEQSGVLFENVQFYPIKITIHFNMTTANC
jgi:hypothetical protein